MEKLPELTAGCECRYFLVEYSGIHSVYSVIIAIMAPIVNG
jgi:hypothetical protein